MKEPDPRNSRLLLAAGIVSLAVVGGGGFVLGRGSTAAPPPPPPSPSSATPIATPSPDTAQALDRAALIGIAAAAADATARGAPPLTLAAEAVGTRFEMAIPFGCSGSLAADDAVSAGWRYDPATGALRVQFPSTGWAPQDWWPEAAPPALQAIEGFWVPRPWTSGETCPTAAPAAETAPGIEPVTLPGQTLAIGHGFTRDGARDNRRDDKPYLAVLRSSPDALRTEHGFRLRLTGRIAAWPDGAVVRCRQPGGPDQRPICLVATTFDAVTMENAATGETIGRWSGAGSPRGD